MQMDTKKRIAIDMDKVLADPISKFIKLVAIKMTV